MMDILIILLLLITNGLLAMAEMAIISSSRHKMNHRAKKSGSAKVALQFIDSPGEFLSTIQIGITIIGIISGAFSGQKFAEPLGIWLNQFAWLQGYGNTLAFTLVVTVMTYFSLVIGELVPKRIALSKPEKMARLLAKPILFLCYLTYPFVVILNFSTKMFLKLWGAQDIKESTMTEEEIYSLLKQGVKEGAIDVFDHKIFRRVLKFGSKEVSLMMTPRIKVVYLDIHADLSDNKHKILTHAHRYYPVFEGGLDHCKGVIDTKDLLSQQMQGHPFDLTPLIKKAPYVIEDNLGPELINQFIKDKTHIAIVIDEYGVMQGIITLLDIFETLIGNVPESHQNKYYDAIVKRSDGSWLCDGLTPIDRIEEVLRIKIVQALEGDFDTLAGLLLMHLKSIPEVGDIVEWNKFRFEIMDMDGVRIDKILISRLSEPQLESE